MKNEAAVRLCDVTKENESTQEGVVIWNERSTLPQTHISTLEWSLFRKAACTLRQRQQKQKEVVTAGAISEKMTNIFK